MLYYPWGSPCPCGYTTCTPCAPFRKVHKVCMWCTHLGNDCPKEKTTSSQCFCDYVASLALPTTWPPETFHKRVQFINPSINMFTVLGGNWDPADKICFIHAKHSLRKSRDVFRLLTLVSRLAPAAMSSKTLGASPSDDASSSRMSTGAKSAAMFEKRVNETVDSRVFLREAVLKQKADGFVDI